MTKFKSEFLNTLSERGFIHQCSGFDGLDALLTQGQQVSAYVGFDCTADSLHVGSLISIIMLRHFQKSGHRPIVVFGGGTTRIGDPSGKDEARAMLSSETINDNMKSLRYVFEVVLNQGDVKFINNAEWLDHLKYIDILRDVGRHMSVNRMLTMDSVRLRIEREQPLSFLEFNYMVLQSYDYVELFRQHGVRLQMGGSDQWGNIVSGIDLGRRMGTDQLYALTSPLLTTASGAKMGKTARGAVWLNKERLSSYDFWQYWRNVEDADVGKFLRLFTELDLGEISRLEKCQGAELNEAKKILANQVTTLVRGFEEAQEAAETARKTFEEGGTGQDLPTVSIPLDTLTSGISVIDAFVSAFGGTKGEIRRLIQGKGVRIDNTVVESQDMMLTSQHVRPEGVKISIGKKRHAVLRSV